MALFLTGILSTVALGQSEGIPNVRQTLECSLRKLISFHPPHCPGRIVLISVIKPVEVALFVFHVYDKYDSPASAATATKFRPTVLQHNILGGQELMWFSAASYLSQPDATVT